MSEMVSVEHHVSISVREKDVNRVIEWMQRFDMMMGDGWAFNQNIQDWVTVNGMSLEEWKKSRA